MVGNWRTINNRLNGTAAAAVVKADAYGLGAAQVVPALAQAGCTCFFVATLDEGVAVRGKVARIVPVEGGDLLLRVESTEDSANPLQEHRHDLVILEQGMIADWNPSASTPVACASDGFVATPMLAAPTRTTAPGIFVAGTAAGPKDIVDTIAEAGAAAMEVSQYLYQKRAAVLAKRRHLPAAI